MNNIFPITVVFAILLFLTKEVIESIKKHRAKSRRKKAFRRLLADECEKNNWTIKSLKRILESIPEDFETNEFKYFRTNQGDDLINFIDKFDGSSSGSVIPNISTSIFNRIIIDISEADESLFGLASEAYAGISEIEHVRKSLINFIVHKEEHPDDILVAFSDYGITELNEAKTSLSLLYKECTGEALEGHKLRSFT